MCGILGFSHLDRRLPAGTLTSGLASLVHRGPDQQGQFVSDHISLGATRLKVLDLEGGDQPLYSPDGDIVLVFNGEIFNYKALRQELEVEGITFQTRCDSEVVLNAYISWGDSCFQRMRGMFAVALWSQSECRLTLARDRMGVKPLYYYIHRGEIYFGSELKCIFAHPEVPRRIDVAGLNCFLSLNYVPGPMTLVEGITKLMPGHLLKWQRGKIKTVSFVEPLPDAPAPVAVEAACEELDGLMRHSVSDHLASDVPVGMWLSGGLDSSSIVRYAAEVTRLPLKTFSVTFQGRSFDDGNYIREVSSFFGTEHHEIDLNPTIELSEAIEEIAYYSDEPSGDAGALPLWFLAKLTRKEVTVALSGEGADELFGGYLTYKADHYRRIVERLPRFIRRAALAGALQVPVSDEKIGFEYKLKRFLHGTLLPSDAAHVFWNGTFTEDEKRRLFRHFDPASLASVLDTMKPTLGLERYMEFDQRFYLPDDILYKVDRMSMAHALEVRPPFLDSRIVDFAARLPESMKIRGGESKYILRRLMKGKLPASVLSRPKIGLDIPIHDWFRGPLRDFLLNTISEEAVRQTNLFHWPVIKGMIDAHLNRKVNIGYHLWGLVTLLVWMKRWDIQSPGRERASVPAIAEPVRSLSS